MTGVAVPLGRLQFIDPLTDGPVAFGTVEHYVPFSSTPKVTWADQGQATANVNPLPLDAAGQPLSSTEGLRAYQDVAGPLSALTTRLPNATTAGPQRGDDGDGLFCLVRDTARP